MEITGSDGGGTLWAANMFDLAMGWTVGGWTWTWNMFTLFWMFWPFEEVLLTFCYGRCGNWLFGLWNIFWTLGLSSFWIRSYFFLFLCKKASLEGFCLWNGLFFDPIKKELFEDVYEFAIAWFLPNILVFPNLDWLFWFVYTLRGWFLLFIVFWLFWLF